MPNRILRDWTASENIDALSPGAEIFLIRLIMKADDYGTYHGNTKLLKSALFPLRDIKDLDVSQWITELVYNKIVVYYEIDGKKYVQINDFGQRLRQMKPKHPQPGDNPRTVDSGPPPEVEVETETKPKQETNLEDRKFKFATSLKTYLNKYSETMLEGFFNYWTEHNEGGQKMRFEMSKNQPFNMSRRLATWKSRQNDDPNGSKKQGAGIDSDYLNELKERTQ